MIKSAVSLLVFVALSSALFVPATHEYIHYEGRVLMNAPNSTSVQFDWSGVVIHLRFTGSSEVYIRLDDVQNMYNIILNGDWKAVLSTVNGSGEYLVINGLDTTKKHHLSITKRTEAALGIVTFGGFILDEDTELIPSHDDRVRKIQFIGDSITCGFGILGLATNYSGTCEPWSLKKEIETENNWQSYGPLTADYFLSEYNILAWSGKGLVINHNNNLPPMPYYWNRTLANSDEYMWNYTSWIPDAVVINLGTNDYHTNAGPIPTEEQMLNGYIDLVDKVNASYPYPPSYFLACGPMIQGTWCDWVNLAVQNLTSLGYQAYYINMTGVLQFPQDFGCEDHPNVYGQSLMSRIASQIIKKYMDW